MSALDKQIGGQHYQTKIQPIDYILENQLGFIEGNVIKYVSRHREKNGAEDIKKAIHYLEILLEKEYEHHGKGTDRNKTTPEGHTVEQINNFTD
jgi:hypothetical protein